MRVFISYARQSGAAAAEGIREALVDRCASVFLDQTSVEFASVFPRAIIDALFNAQVFVIVLDALYVTRWYCIRELKIALAAQERAAKNGQYSPAILVALAEQPSADTLRALPPALQERNWPSAGDTVALTSLVDQIARSAPTFGAFLTRLDPSVLALSEGARIPPPAPLGRPVYPRHIPASRNEAFYGRADELWHMDHYLSNFDSRSSSWIQGTVLLQGFAGVGKSQLAVEYVHRFGRRFPGGVFWLDGGVSTADFEHQVTELAQRVTVLDPIAGDPRRSLSEWATRRGEPILLVVDDIPQVRTAEARPFHHWCPLHGVAAVLATSRDDRYMHETGVHTMNVPPLLVDDGMKMLTAPPVEVGALSEDEWRRLVRAVGELPLALNLLHSAMGVLSPDEVQAQMATSERLAVLDDVYLRLKPWVPEGAVRGVARAFDLTHDILTNPAKTTAYRFAVLSPAPIPWALADRLGSGDVLIELKARAVILPTRDQRGRPFGRVHRLYADYLKARPRDGWFRRLLRSPSRDVRNAIRDCAKAISNVLEQSDPSFDTLFSVAPHVEWLFQHALDDPRMLKDPKFECMLEDHARATERLLISHETDTEGLSAMKVVLRRAADDDVPNLRGDLLLIFGVASKLAALDHPAPPRELDLHPFGVVERQPDRRYIVDRSAEGIAAVRNTMTRRIETYEVRISLLGQRHIATLKTAIDVALGFLVLEDLPAAEKWFRTVAELSIAREGTDAPNTMVAKWHLLYLAVAQDAPRETRHAIERELFRLLEREVGSLPSNLRAVRLLLIVSDAISQRDAKRGFTKASEDDLRAYVRVTHSAPPELQERLYYDYGLLFSNRADELRKSKH